MKRSVGAPKGGRVHWLLWHLPSDFKGAYQLYYNYSNHNYVFVRNAGKQVYDVFIVIHTSKHWFRVMWACPAKKKFEYMGYKNTRIIAEWMYEKYKEV